MALPGALAKRIIIPTKPTKPESLILEAWSQGFMVGALIVMLAITIANLRKGVLLHKLILLELFLGLWHGTFIFFNEPTYGWYLSSTAVLLNFTYSLHNVIAWMKTKPFLSRRWSQFYISTVILVQPYWVVELFSNFSYFNNWEPANTWFHKTRPLEAIFRDPWWIFTIVNLFYNISTRYNMSLVKVVGVSPRFGVLLTAMLISIAFLITDICSVLGAFKSSLPEGLNPFWKFAFVFKCLTDSIILDDFKTALDRLMIYKLRKERMDSCYADNSTNDGRSSRSRDVEMIEDFEEFHEGEPHRKETQPIQPGPMRHGQKAMPTNVSHYDEISLPDLEHFASTHTWKGA